MTELHEHAEGPHNALVHVVVSDGVARLTLNSPHNRNALSAQLRGELLAGLRAADADESVRVIVLAHEGTVFCAGADLKEVGRAASAGSADEFTEILRTLMASPKPVIAQVEGAARAADSASSRPATWRSVPATPPSPFPKCGAAWWPR
jgi:enoyl-CoA hydratase/carnithine racemase